MKIELRSVSWQGRKMFLPFPVILSGDTIVAVGVACDSRREAMTVGRKLRRRLLLEREIHKLDGEIAILKKKQSSLTKKLDATHPEDPLNLLDIPEEDGDANLAAAHRKARDEHGHVQSILEHGKVSLS
jgi:hypothetical protein